MDVSWRFWGLIGGLAALLLISAVVLSPYHPREYIEQTTDTITVIDGNTLQFHNQVIKLSWVDAPELGQTCIHDGKPTHCGLNAAYALRKLVVFRRESPLRCDSHGTGFPWRRADCTLNGLDLGLVLLEDGYAVPTPDAPSRFKEAASRAKAERLGLWAMEFVLPWQWRDGMRLSGRSATDRSNCNIVGIVVPDGRHLYFTPLDYEYSEHPLHDTDAETVFCSDEEARLAGWRRPGENLGAEVDPRNPGGSTRNPERRSAPQSS